jgi:hypothetical protein
MAFNLQKLYSKSVEQPAKSQGKNLVNKHLMPDLPFF